MRKINITIACPDNDLAEYNLEQKIYYEIGRENIIDYRKFPNVEQFKEDSYYKKLIKEKKELQRTIDNYILNKKL